MMPYCFVKSVSNLIVNKSDILYYKNQRCVQQVPFIGIETRPLRITPFRGADDSVTHIYRMNYEHFVHTAAEMLQKYAPKLLN